MFGRERPSAWLLVSAIAALAGAAGCAQDPLPQSQRPTVDQAIRSGRGSFVKVTVDGVPVAYGELISVTHNEILVLSEGRLGAVPRERVSEARVFVHRTYANDYAGWTGIGAISTLTHGYYLVISAPIWALTGLIISVGEAQRGQVLYEPRRAFWDDMRPYARFPQGLPPGVTADEVIHGRRLPMPAAAPSPGGP